MKKILIFVLALVLSLSAILGLTACTDNDADNNGGNNNGGEQMTGGVVTQEVWENCFKAENFSNVKIDSKYGLAMEDYECGLFELDGDTVRCVDYDYQGFYKERIYVKVDENTYTKYYRNNKNDTFNVGEASANDYEIERVGAISASQNLLIQIENGFANANYDTENGVYTLNMESIVMDESLTITDVEYVITFVDGELKKVNFKATDSYRGYRYKIIMESTFGNVKITIPTADMIETQN